MVNFQTVVDGSWCPLCKRGFVGPTGGETSASGHKITHCCQICGVFRIEPKDDFQDILSKLEYINVYKKAALAHLIKTKTLDVNGIPLCISKSNLEQIIENLVLPSIEEQKKKFIMFLGKKVIDSRSLDVLPDDLFVIVGSLDYFCFINMVKELESGGIINCRFSQLDKIRKVNEISLTQAGMKYYKQLIGYSLSDDS